MRYCTCCNGYEGSLRREEIRHGGVTEEELPHRPKATKKPRKPKHKHDWEINWTYERPWHPFDAMSVYCTVCGRWDFWKL